MQTHETCKTCRDLPSLHNEQGCHAPGCTCSKWVPKRPTCSLCGHVARLHAREKGCCAASGCRCGGFAPSGTATARHRRFYDGLCAAAQALDVDPSLRWTPRDGKSVDVVTEGDAVVHMLVQLTQVAAGMLRPMWCECRGVRRGREVTCAASRRGSLSTIDRVRR